MNTEEKINNSIVEIDFNKKSLKGYCRKKEFLKQMERIKELNKMEV